MGPTSLDGRVKVTRSSGTAVRAPWGPKTTAWRPFSPTRPGSIVSWIVPLPPGVPVS